MTREGIRRIDQDGGAVTKKPTPLKKFTHPDFYEPGKHSFTFGGQFLRHCRKSVLSRCKFHLY